MKFELWRIEWGYTPVSHTVIALLMDYQKDRSIPGRILSYDVEGHRCFIDIAVRSPKEADAAIMAVQKEHNLLEVDTTVFAYLKSPHVIAPVLGYWTKRRVK